MNIVIDTSAIIAVLINERSKKSIIRTVAGCTLIAAQSIDAEIGNAISAMFKRKRINLIQAEKVIMNYNQIAIRKEKIRILDAIKLSLELNIYAYDAYVLDTALKFKAPVLTLDKELERKAQELNIEILEI
ncbi:MAG: type II toxin-antitoxin system VapC family toxin [Balneola sp.]|nr:type II toxin-antitoxin system VapC family toxin [Balneola sp.]MBO6651999.1 type II toxin-antitoxin system VapC family toxin [Balneola sp.]MBO6712687.1 type II toxin-antitoxin system VapC family toxin [Balneola sp.]MBO6801349.1 type II toxin-antitoxin system VapC family toxin [Balneola sp.]MBO6870492.1 type II toxin-antitoxin system VapC family toxin [Balneola sp.]